jgi:hypothetical protein
MSITNVISTLQSFSFVPPKSICRGKEASGRIKIDYYIDSNEKINGFSEREKLKEAKEDGTVTFTKPGETKKTSAELKKEGKPISNPPKVKVK